MSSTAHKRIVFAGMGCAVMVVGLIVLGVVLAVREKPTLFSEIAAMSEFATPNSAAQALDSLQKFDWSPLERPRPNPLTLAITRDGNGAAVALDVWNRPRLRYGIVPLGEPEADNERGRGVWYRYATQPWVDSLIEAARHPWILSEGAIGNPAPGGAVLKTTLTAFPVLNTTRAMLGQAELRWRVDSSKGLEVVRATVNIGRALQADRPLIHRVIGLRVEKEVLLYLVTRHDSLKWAPLMAQVDEALDHTTRGLRLIRIAGGDAGNATALARAAQDGSLPVPVRREILISIGYGWALNMMEGNTMMLRSDRSAALKSIEPGTVPAALRATLDDARATAQLDIARRMVVGPEYQTLTSSLRATW